MAAILIVIGLALSINGIFLCIFSNFNLGVILTLMAGMFFVLWGLFYSKIRTLNQSKAWSVVKNIVITLICLELILVGFIAIYGQYDNVSYDEDVLIVLGAGVRGDKVTLPLKLRLDKAVEYHNKNPEALIVVSGGQGLQETVTEASAMEKYLVEAGVNPNVIVKEEKAASTNENMRFSKDLLDRHFDAEYKTSVVTNNFHIYRAVSIAESEGLGQVTHMHAGLQWYNLAPCYLRESLAVLKMWVFD